MLIVTNAPRFPAVFTDKRGLQGRAVQAQTVAEFLKYAGEPGVVFAVNCDPALVFGLSAALFFRPKPQLVAVDIVLRRPNSLKSRALLWIRRQLLRRVDLFVHLFRDVRGLTEVWGVPAGRSTFVPFKPNLPAPAEGTESDRPGRYILCFGRSLRDYDTFFDAVAQLPYPAAIPEPNPAHLRAHGARFTRELAELPPNVELIPDDQSDEAQRRILRDAKLVVLPVLKTSMVASGISTCLNAMMYGRCVIGSEGPGMSDIFEEEVLTCPPEDTAALAAVIRRAWEDDELRNRTAAAGERYARALGGEQEFYQRVIDAIAEWGR